MVSLGPQLDFVLIIYYIFESLFIFSVAYLLLNAASYNGKIWLADVYRPCAGHVLGFMSIVGVVVTKIMLFVLQMLAVDPAQPGG